MSLPLTQCFQSWIWVWDLMCHPNKRMKFRNCEKNWDPFEINIWDFFWERLRYVTLHWSTMSMSTISTMSHPPCPRPHFGQVMFYFQIVLTLSFFCVRFSTFQYFTLFNIVVDLCWLCPFFMFVLAFLCILLDLCWFCQFFVQALTFTCWPVLPSYPTT